MHFNKLALRNFLSHSDTTIDLEPLTIFRASNSAGKSAIADAISLMLCGRADRTDDRGAGAKEMIRKGEDKALVGAQVMFGKDESSLRMSLTEKSGRTLMAKNGKEESPEIIEYLATRRDVLSCLCNTNYFIDMKENEQKDFLAGIVLPKHIEWTEEIKSIAHGAGFTPVWTLSPFYLIDNMYGSAYDKRTDTNRALRALAIPDKPADSTLNIDDIRARLAERQKQRTELAVQRMQLLDKHETQVKAVDKLAHQRTHLGFKLNTAKLQLSGMKCLGDEAVKHLKKVAAQEQKAKLLDEQISSITRAQRVNQDALNALDGLGECAACPTCSQPVTEEIVAAIGRPLKEEHDKMTRELRDAFDKRKALGDYEGAKKALAGHEQSVRDAATVQANISQYEKELATIPDDATATPPDTSEIDAQIAKLDANIEKGNSAYYEAGQQVQKLREYERAVEQKKALDEKLVLLEKLVEYFGPNGIKAKLLDEHVGGFVAKMNVALGKWGYACQLSFEPYRFAMQMHTGEGFGFNLRMLSKSQKYRFAVAFQLALAELTEGFCVIDGADILDGAGRQALFTALRGAGLEQVIVLSTDERKEAPKVANTVFYSIGMTLENGVPTSHMVKL